MTNVANAASRNVSHVIAKNRKMRQLLLKVRHMPPKFASPGDLSAVDAPIETACMQLLGAILAIAKMKAAVLQGGTAKGILAAKNPAAISAPARFHLPGGLHSARRPCR